MSSRRGTRNIDRRFFLWGLGGACITAPFLGSLAERAAVGQEGPAPRRLIAMFTHYGCITERWFPAKSHGELTAADFEGTSLDVLKDLAPKLLMPRGIRGINEWSFGKEFGQETDPHEQVMASYLTATPVDRESAFATGVSSDRFTARPLGHSIDHVIAEQVNPTGIGPMVAHIGGTRTDTVSTLSYSEPGVAYRGVGSPAQMFAALTKLNAEAAAASEDSFKMLVRGQSAVDIVRDDLNFLNRANMSTSDRRKLEHWMDLLHETSNSVRALECSADTAEAIGANENVPSTAGTSDLTAATKVMMDIATMLAICDENRIQFLMFPANHRMGFIEGVDNNVENHGLSHRIGNANMGGTCLDGANDMLERIDRWHAEQFSYLVRQLDTFEEGDGTLLDNTAAVWLMEQSDGQAHNTNNLPILQAGSCGGYFKTGVAVNVEDGSADLPRGNSLGQCSDGDTSIDFSEVEGTGTPNEFANAPFNKYLYNLANALGVKANEEGFPEVGGTEKVSRFGWSDDPQMYATFDVNEPFEDQPGTFIDPGEFEDLLA